MAQRYTPSQLQLLIDDGSTLGRYPDPVFNAAEFNTLLLAVEFSDALAVIVVKPWVNIRSKNAADVVVNNWQPLAPVTITAEADTANMPAPITTDYDRAPPEEIALPNCHEVQVELISISAGTVNLWGAPANRAPR